jgi:hypothetical protein
MYQHQITLKAILTEVVCSASRISIGEVLKLYYSEINELLKYSADSSAFVGHTRLLPAECPNLGDLVPLRKSDSI